MGEIDDPHHAKDDGEPDRDQDQHAHQRRAVEKLREQGPEL